MREPVIDLPVQVQAAQERLRAHGYRAYAVGGCVRDSLLGRAPNDWDLTTSARPEQVLAVFSDCRCVQIGIRHGTVGVLLDGMMIEITTFRNDGDYADHRHPVSVTFSDTVEEDLSRRDFTVNAMAYDGEGGVVDLFDGQGDLSRRLIRCVGEPSVRFEEDGLRILRAIRFAAVLDFSVEAATAEAIHQRRALLGGIAAERIREKLCKLIVGRGAVRILREYMDVIGTVLPELLACRSFDQNTKYHCYDVLEHSLASLAENRGEDLLTRLAILLHDVGKPVTYSEDAEGGHFKGHAAEGVRMVREITARLRFDNDTAERLCLLIELHDLPISPDRRAVKRLLRRMKEEDVLRLLEVKRCDRLAHAPDYRALPTEWEMIPRLMDELRAEGACLTLRDLAVGGDDLIAMGIPRGRQLGAYLSELLEEVLDEHLVNEREVLLARVRELREQEK